MNKIGDYVLQHRDWQITPSYQQTGINAANEYY